jgi:4-diphosphocytidyl-2-C-methyl-D-erythritol kinase
MSGIGEVVSPVASMPAVWLVLVNPRVAVPTGAVFSALAGQFGAPMPDMLPDWPDAQALSSWLETQRNDLEPPARRLAPEIGTVLSALAEQRGCLIARMSGSGGTCFGVFADEKAAHAAADAVEATQPQWWVASAPILR